MSGGEGGTRAGSRGVQVLGEGRGERRERTPQGRRIVIPPRLGARLSASKDALPLFSCPFALERPSQRALCRPLLSPRPLRSLSPHPRPPPIPSNAHLFEPLCIFPCPADGAPACASRLFVLLSHRQRPRVRVLPFRHFPATRGVPACARRLSVLLRRRGGRAASLRAPSPPSILFPLCRSCPVGARLAFPPRGRSVERGGEEGRGDCERRATSYPMPFPHAYLF